MADKSVQIRIIHHGLHFFQSDLGRITLPMQEIELQAPQQESMGDTEYLGVVSGPYILIQARQAQPDLPQGLHAPPLHERLKEPRPDERHTMFLKFRLRKQSGEIEGYFIQAGLNI